jgi:hypothetical protein
MPKLSLPAKLIAAGVLVLAAVVGVGFLTQRTARAEPLSQPPTADAWKDLAYKPSGDCAACHTSPIEARIKDTDFVLLTESAIWRAYDKHAQAYAVLEGGRGRQIGKVLFRDEKAVLKAENGCLSCHAMQNLNELNEKTRADAVDLKDGVSCTGCHGPGAKKDGSGGWLTEHADPKWRDNTPEVKYQKGMRNVRDPAVRAELCMSCHIGNAAEGKVVSHAMMAAGHPPLPPIELATFSKNEPQHWRNARDVPYLKKGNATIKKNYDLQSIDFQQTRAALIGSVVAVRETLKLAHDRADFSKPESYWPELAGAKGDKAADRWPELAMAHSDCYACHHDLRFPGYRQSRGFGYNIPGTTSARVIPGRPIVRLWPFGGLTAAMLYTGKASKASEVRAQLDKLVEATNARPFGDPTKVRSSTEPLIAWCNALVKELSSADFTSAKVRDMVKEVIKIYSSDDPSNQADHETARDVASLLRVACMELKLADTDKPLEALTTSLNLEPYFNRDKRLEIMRSVLWEALNPSGGMPSDRFNKGFDDFKTHLKMLKDGKEFTDADFRKLIDNDLLSDLSRKLNNQSFNTALLKKSDALQKLSDEEEQKTLDSISKYNVKDFKDALKALGDQIK